MSSNQDGTISKNAVDGYRLKFASNPAYKMAMNAVTRGNLNEIAINRTVLNEADVQFTNEIEVGPITDQKASGTCWLFAELNWLRTYTNKKLNIKNFEFSQNYVLFWDKLEKANYFLENIVALADVPLDDRRMHHLLSNPSPDGGEWNMLVNVIRKYGLVPKGVMPDTFNRENTRYLNHILNWKLREAAATLRKLSVKGSKPQAAREYKEKVMAQVYRILAINLGEPPVKFNWAFRKNNKKKQFVRWSGLTPKQFYDKAVGIDLDDIFVLISCPMKDTPFNKTFTVEFFNNTWGGSEMLSLNLPVEELKKYAVKIIKAGEACLFGCEVRLDMHSKEGICDTELFDYGLVFDTEFVLDKAERLEYGQARMTHAMVFAGVDIEKGKPARWKVENSWGDQFGKKGFFIMSDCWFDEHVFEVVIPKKHLSKKHLDMFKARPKMLPAWHPLA